MILDVEVGTLEVMLNGVATNLRVPWPAPLYLDIPRRAPLAGIYAVGEGLSDGFIVDCFALKDQTHRTAYYVSPRLPATSDVRFHGLKAN